MRVIDVSGPDINNGLGCRVTVWAAGCNHHCPGCHNPETWNYDQGDKLSDVEYKVFDKAKYDYISGLTFSGGDPLAQNTKSLIRLYKFIKKFKKKFPNKDIWIYSGDYYENLRKRFIIRLILRKCDVLVDGPFIIKERNIKLPFRGSNNQRIIDLNATRKNNEMTLLSIE